MVQLIGVIPPCKGVVEGLASLLPGLIVHLLIDDIDDGPECPDQPCIEHPPVPEPAVPPIGQSHKEGEGVDLPFSLPDQVSVHLQGPVE
jgi:hypothetical protein